MKKSSENGGGGGGGGGGGKNRWISLYPSKCVHPFRYVPEGRFSKGLSLRWWVKETHEQLKKKGGNYPWTPNIRDWREHA